MVLQACLNGDRETGVPRTAEELAAEAKACVAAGVVSLHVHPRDGDGHETLEPGHIAAAIRALRAAVPRSCASRASLACAMPPQGTNSR